MSGRCRAGDKLHDGVKILVFAQASKVERLPQFGLPLIPLQLNLFEEIARLLIGRTTDELLVSEREFAAWAQRWPPGPAHSMGHMHITIWEQAAVQ